MCFAFPVGIKRGRGASYRAERGKMDFLSRRCEMPPVCSKRLFWAFAKNVLQHIDLYTKLVYNEAVEENIQV
jgi:hypothetical protein